MTLAVDAETITSAWLESTEALNSLESREAFNLVVTILDPRAQSIDPRVVSTLNVVLCARHLQPVQTVANTIFPSALFPSGQRTAQERARSYSRYDAVLPVIRRHSKNRRGIYFQRLTDYPSRPRGTRVNQIERIICSLQAERSHPSPLRFIYEAQVNVPGLDLRPIGFPCMSSLSFQLNQSVLHLTATYRNQYYIERALGNFIGLAALQSFVAEQAGLTQGPLTVHAFHAQIDPGFGRAAVGNLLQNCRTTPQVCTSSSQ